MHRFRDIGVNISRKPQNRPILSLLSTTFRRKIEEFLAEFNSKRLDSLLSLWLTEKHDSRMSLGIPRRNSVRKANFGKCLTILGDFDFLTYANVVLSP